MLFAMTQFSIFATWFPGPLTFASFVVGRKILVAAGHVTTWDKEGDR